MYAKNVYQYRWRPSNRGLYAVPAWTRRYRQRGDGSFPGTGPAIYNLTAYFTDNTYPISLRGPSYSLFAIHLASIESDGSTTRAVTTADYLNVVDFTAEQKGTQGVILRALKRPAPLPLVTRRQSLLESSATTPGFMFFSVVINPVEESLIVWDTEANSVQCRHLANLTSLNLYTYQAYSKTSRSRLHKRPCNWQQSVFVDMLGLNNYKRNIRSLISQE